MNTSFHIPACVAATLFSLLPPEPRIINALSLSLFAFLVSLLLLRQGKNWAADGSRVCCMCTAGSSGLTELPLSMYILSLTPTVFTILDDY